MNIFYRFIFIATAFLPALLFSRCGVSVYYVVPPDWQSNHTRDSTMNYYSSALKGRTIFLDPGHGGDDRKNKGPAGDVVEADVNLRVALTLRNFLKQAGANVIMSRESDQTVSLDARATQANANNADLFISIHHNAAENTFTNYTSTWYHSMPGRQNYHPSSHDLARYIQRDLAFVMGNPGSLASFDGTMSDNILYPDKGLAVLRDSKMSAVLVECAFYSSEYEEQRLKRPDFNDIQAWGIFRGIGKYLKAGTPKIVYQSSMTFTSNRPVIEISVHDPSGIDDESIRIYVDGKEEGFSFNAKTGVIKITPGEELSNGFHQLTARVRNKNNNHSFPFTIYFSIGVAPAALKSTLNPDAIPPDSRAFSIVSITPVDSAGNHVPDGLPIRLSTNAGLDSIIYTQGGTASITLTPTDNNSITFAAHNGPLSTNGTIAVRKNALYTRGLIITSEGKAAAGASISFPDGKKITATLNGEYIIGGTSYFGVETVISKKGYFSKREAFTDDIVQEPIVLSPIARGTMQKKIILLDLLSIRGDKAMLKDSLRLDVQLAKRLASLIDFSGGESILIDGIAAGANERRKLISKYPTATIIHVGMDANKSIISSFASDLESSKQLARDVMKSLPLFTGLLLLSNIPRYPQRDESSKMRQVSIFIPTPGLRSFEARLIPLVASNIAWGIYHGLLISEGYSIGGTKKVEVSVMKKNTKEPAALVDVILNGTLRTVTDSKGNCKFFGVTITEDDVRVLDPAMYEVSGVKTEVLN